MQGSTIHHYQPGRPHWWQWLTVLSLDAPLVAIAWQVGLARAARLPLREHHGFILGAAVWLAYAADRWIEGWRLVPGQVLTQRHFFYLRWRWPVAVVWLLVLTVAVGVSVMRLTERELVTGLLLLVPVLVYLLSHQLVHRHHPRRAPKEVCVALLFAAGAICFPAARHPAVLLEQAGPLGLFALLCFTNCSLIAIWEGEVDRAHEQTSLALQFPRSHGLVRWLPWFIFALGLGLAWHGPAAGLAGCAAASGALLGLLDRLHLRFGRQLSRALADLVLLTPFILLVGEKLAGP
ncbi:MAG TPA: hypothetical protein VGD97_02000 [Lacunisphaera sp.]